MVVWSQASTIVDTHPHRHNPGHIALSMSDLRSKATYTTALLARTLHSGACVHIPHTSFNTADAIAGTSASLAH